MTSATAEDRAKSSRSVSPTAIKTPGDLILSVASLQRIDVHCKAWTTLIELVGYKMSASLQKAIYTGTFIFTHKLDALDIQEHLAIGVDEEGVIRRKSNLLPSTDKYDRDKSGNDESQVKAIAIEWGWGEQGWKWVSGGNRGNSWWFPGFVGE